MQNQEVLESDFYFCFSTFHFLVQTILELGSTDDKAVSNMLWYDLYVFRNKKILFSSLSSLLLWLIFWYLVFYFVCYIVWYYDTDVFSVYKSSRVPSGPRRSNDVFFSSSSHFSEWLQKYARLSARIGKDAHSVVDPLTTILRASWQILARDLTVSFRKN